MLGWMFLWDDQCSNSQTGLHFPNHNDMWEAVIISINVKLKYKGLATAYKLSKEHFRKYCLFSKEIREKRGSPTRNFVLIQKETMRDTKHSGSL